MAGRVAGPFPGWGRRWSNTLRLTLRTWRVFWKQFKLGSVSVQVTSPFTFGVTVLEGDGPLMLSGEAPTTWEAQGPSCFRLVGAAWTWLAGLEPVYGVLASQALTCNESRAQL